MAAGALLPGTSIRPTKANLKGFIPRNKRSSFSGVTFEIQGLNVLTEHWFVVAQLTDQLAPGVLDFYADIITHNARQFVRKDTWATHDSIDKGDGVMRFANGDYEVDIGADTLQARFLEWGTVNQPAYPFMVPALDMSEKDYFRAFLDIARIADTVSGRASLRGDVGRDGRIRSPISRARSGLYSLSKVLGDISVFGGREFLSPIRQFALLAARGIGDVDSLMKGAMGARISRRLRGRATGRLAGFGSASLSASRTYTASVGGQRIYNRLVGRISAPVVTTRIGF